MGRLIDVNKFKADYGMKDDCADCDKELRGKSKACEYDRVYTKMDFCGWLDDAPTVDAVPVVHGRWECSDKYENAVCSICGYDTGEAYGFGYGIGCYNFCPVCGARMDGKDGEHG